MYGRIVALAVWFALPALAQVPAFPGALGYGANASGGRNGTVYHVTTLADSGPGSFRDAVSHSGRTIVFDVGGHIQLASAVSCAGNLTIAGQTAPGGICFDAGEISFAGRSNIICRYIRIRPGSATTSTGDDCISLYNAQNAIFDHVSMEFGPWNNLDAVSGNWQVTPVTSITFQHCIDANPIYQQFGAHTECPSANWTWCYNIFANSHNRNPLAKVNTVFINNIEYNNSAGYTTHTSTPFKHDIVNNYFVAGPASGGNFPWYQIDNNQGMYFSGNYYDSDKNGVLGGGLTAPLPGYQGGGTILTAPWSPWTTVIPTVSAAVAWRYDLSAAGAFPRDDMDALVVSQMKTLGSGTTGTGAGTSGPDGGLYTSQTQTGLPNNGYGTFSGGVAPANYSGDGIAAYWKLANNLSTNVSYPLTNTANGYTLLENYLNFLAGPHAVTQTNVPMDIDLSPFVSGFSAGASFSLSNATNGTASLLNSTTARFAPAANFSGLGTFTFTVTEGSYSLNAAVTVCVTPVVPPDSATSFNGALIGVALVATAPPNNLLWRGDGTANAWNSSVSNWLNGASPSAFKNGDVVTFDDTGFSTPAVNVAAAVSPGAVLFNSTKDYTLAGSGALSGSGSLAKTGSGTVTVGTTNSSFAGSVSVSGGTLALNPGTSIGSGGVTLSGGANLSLAGGGVAVSIPGSITVPAGESATITSGYIANGGYGSFISGDAGSVLNLVGNQSFGGSSGSQFNGFSGTINIASGSIRFSTASSGNTFGSLNPNFILNGTLQPRNAGNTIVLGALNGSGSLQGPQSPGTGTGATVYNIGGKNQDAIFNGTIISNANSAGSVICLNKLGIGAQTLNGNNTCTGTNAVLAGSLFLNGTNQPALCTVFSGATLGGTGVITGPVSVNSGGNLSPGASGSGSAGTLTLGSHLTNNTPTLYFDLSGSPAGMNDRINVAGTLAMSGVQTFNFNLTDNALGAGTYGLIEGANNSTASSVSFASNLPGNTRQSISFARAAAGSNPSYVRLLVSGNAASLLWSGTNGGSWDTSTVNWLRGGSADQFYNLDSVTFNDSSTHGAVSLVGALQPGAILVDNASLAYSFSGAGALSGSAPLTKTGAGTLTISTTNSSYTGSILLAGGTLAANAPSALGSGMLTLSNGAALTLPASGNFYFGGTVNVPANTSGTISSSALGNGLSGNLLSGNSASSLTLLGGVSFSGTTPAQFDGYSGTINLLSGATLRFSANSSGNTYGSVRPWFVINGLLQPRNAGNTVVLGSLAGSGTLAGPQANAGSGDTLYLLGGSDQDSVFSGTISSNSAVAESDVIVNKTGAGRLTFTGSSTYAGGTTVSAGTLRVNNLTGSATGSGDVEVFAGATLSGRGVIAGGTTVDAGATLAPGDPAGTLTIANNLTLSDGSFLQFTLGTNASSVAVAGDLLLTGRLNVQPGDGFGVGVYTLFSCGGALTVGNLGLGSAPAGFNYSFDTRSAGVVKLIVSPTTPPKLNAPAFSGGMLVLSGSGGTPLGTYYVASTTNLALPLTNWTTLATNQFDSNGNFVFTNAPGVSWPGAFFVLLSNPQ